MTIVATWDTWYQYWLREQYKLRLLVWSYIMFCLFHGNLGCFRLQNWGNMMLWYLDFGAYGYLLSHFSVWENSNILIAFIWLEIARTNSYQCIPNLPFWNISSTAHKPELHFFFFLKHVSHKKNILCMSADTINQGKTGLNMKQSIVVNCTFSRHSLCFLCCFLLYIDQVQGYSLTQTQQTIRMFRTLTIKIHK